jgi:hypothetical protein
MRYGDISNQLAEAIVINADNILLLASPGLFKKPRLNLVVVRIINNLAKNFDYRIILISTSKHYKKIVAAVDKYCFYNEFHYFKDVKELAEWLDTWDIYNYVDSDTEILSSVFPRGLLYSGDFKNTLERLR